MSPPTPPYLSQLVDIFGSGLPDGKDSFGELALLYNAPRAATVVPLAPELFESGDAVEQKARVPQKLTEALAPGEKETTDKDSGSHNANSPFLWALSRRDFRRFLRRAAAGAATAAKTALRRVPFLRQLRDEQIEALSVSVRSEDFAKGDVIIRKGERGDRFFIVQDGSVGCSVVDIPDEVKNVAELVGSGGTSGNTVQPLHDRKLVLGLGEAFGERALLSGKRGVRAASVWAESREVRLLSLDRHAFRTLLGPLGKAIRANLAAEMLASLPWLGGQEEESTSASSTSPSSSSTDTTEDPAALHSSPVRVLAELATQVQYAVGERVTAAGHSSAAMCLIKSGGCTVVKGVLAFLRPARGASGSAKGSASNNDANEPIDASDLRIDRTRGEVVAQLGVGASFGEAALFGRSTHRYSIIAGSLTQIYRRALALQRRQQKAKENANAKGKEGQNETEENEEEVGAGPGDGMSLFIVKRGDFEMRPWEGNLGTSDTDLQKFLSFFYLSLVTPLSPPPLPRLLYIHAVLKVWRIVVSPKEQ